MSPLKDPIGRRSAMLPFMGSEMLLEEWREACCVCVTVDPTRCSPVHVVMALEATVADMSHQSYPGLRHAIYLPNETLGIDKQRVSASLTAVDSVSSWFWVQVHSTP